MNFLQRMKLAFNSTAMEDHIRAFLSGADVNFCENGVDVRDDKALRYSAVFGCCRVLAETFASVPFMMYRRLADGDRERVTNTGVYNIFHNQPNSEMSAFNLHETLMYNLNLGGNFYSQVQRSSFGEPLVLNPYMYGQVDMQRNKETKRMEYLIADSCGAGAKTVKTKPEIFHIPGLSINGLKGLSPISYARGAIALGVTYEKFTTQFYNNGAFPAGVFKHPGTLNDDAYSRLKDSLGKEYTRVKNAGTPMLLEDGLEYDGLTITPMDSQLLESKKFQIEDVCRIYRVPLHLVQNLDKATNNNIEHQSLEFVMYTMLPWFRRVEAAINTQLLSPADRRAGVFVEYNMAGLLRGDQKATAEAFARGRQWGWLSVNDIRRLLNMNSIGDAGDIYLQPLNMKEAGTDGTAAESANKGVSNSHRPPAEILEEINKLMDEAQEGAVNV